MSIWQLTYDELEQQLDRPLEGAVSSIVCGRKEKLQGSGMDDADNRLQVVWRSDVEPRVLAGLPWGLVLSVATGQNLQGWRMPRVTGAQTLAENMQRLWSRNDWQAGFVPSNVVRSPLTPPVPVGLSRWQTWLLTQIPSGTHAAQRVARVALEAGARLLADDLDGSHRCSQSIEGEGEHRTGDYWHAIMHRREPDYGNSRYWFRRVGLHPAFAAVVAELLHWGRTTPDTPPFLSDLPQQGWRPEVMIRACEAASANPWLPEIQYREMLVLYRFSCDEFLAAR